jgi:predicted AAA+ superfamily ATPase
MIPRSLKLPEPGEETFFLWGPRQTGKTTLLRARYPHAYWIDLLKSDQYRRLLGDPSLLGKRIASMDRIPFVVIDEVQKLPELLDEVHWLHENLGVRFALCGSSARKLKRGKANLLGGRALRYELRGLVSAELGEGLDLVRTVNRGFLPRIHESTRSSRLLESYVGDYLKEEVAAEGLVRNLPAFSEFLTVAALSDAEQVNASAIARETGVSNKTVKGYFDILVDTLQGSWLPAFRERPKRRVQVSPKFYFSDVGVVNHLARRGRIEPGSELFGKAFENWVHHELRAYDAYSHSMARLSYWRLASGIEVDFVVGDMALAIEVKASKRIRRDHLRGLRQLAVDHPGVVRRIVVCLEDEPYTTEDRVEILPWRRFARELWSGDLF